MVVISKVARYSIEEDWTISSSGAIGAEVS
jgi:hypothetical protein